MRDIVLRLRLWWAKQALVEAWETKDSADRALDAAWLRVERLKAIRDPKTVQRLEAERCARIMAPTERRG